MYLKGEIYFWGTGGKRKKKEGFEKSTETYELGYWRKHPNLHGFIVEQFAKGEDNCQNIDLCKEDVQKIIQAIKDKDLPTTEGFFFGVSTEDEDAEDIKVLEKALEWVDAKKKGESRTIVYRASW